MQRICREGGPACGRCSESAGRVGARLRAIQLGAIACKQAPPNRVNLLSKANRLSRRSALTGREPRATFPRPRGGSPGPRPIRAAMAARGRKTRSARRGPLGSRAPFARPKPPRLPRPAALTPSGCLDPTPSAGLSATVRSFSSGFPRIQPPATVPARTAFGEIRAFVGADLGRRGQREARNATAARPTGSRGGAKSSDRLVNDDLLPTAFAEWARWLSPLNSRIVA